MTSRAGQLLLAAPDTWTQAVEAPLAAAGIEIRVHGRDEFQPQAISYVLSFRPPSSLLTSLPNLRAIFSLGAGVDGFLSDPTFPAHIPLVRFVDASLSIDMTQYIVLHALMHHRHQRDLDAAQRKLEWVQEEFVHRQPKDTRAGLLGLGEIGTMAARRLGDLGFAVAGWTRSAKTVTGIETFAGEKMLGTFLARTDILICVLPLTGETRGILNAANFAQLPAGAFVINAARGGHLIEQDLIDAIDSGHLSGAALDVFATEPLPASSPIWAHPKISVSPHIAAVSYPAAVVRMVVEGVDRLESGRPLANVVDLAKGY